MSNESKRFNEWKELVDKKGNAFIRGIMHLLDPHGRYPAHNAIELVDLFDDWLMTAKASDTALKENYHAKHYMPMLPLAVHDEYKPCMHAWAILTSCMVQGDFCTRAYIPGIVKIIQDSPACATHISTCPCKFPNHQFTHHNELKLLAPLGIPHNPDCRCTGFACQAVLDAQKTKEHKHTLEVIAKHSAMCADTSSVEELKKRYETALTAFYSSPSIPVPDEIRTTCHRCEDQLYYALKSAPAAHKLIIDIADKVRARYEGMHRFKVPDYVSSLVQPAPGAPKKANAAPVGDDDFAKNLFKTFQGVTCSH